MKKCLAMLLAIMLMIVNLIPAGAEDAPEICSDPIESVVLESEDAELPEEGETPPVEGFADSVIDKTVEAASDEALARDEDMYEEGAQDDAGIETGAVEDGDVPIDAVIANTSEPDEPSAGNAVPPNAVQQEQLVPEASELNDESTPEIDDAAAEEAEAELEDEFTAELSGETALFAAEEADDNAECEEAAPSFTPGMMAVDASSLQRPVDVDNGYWVDAYKRYMDNYSEYKGCAVLVDFDFDGIPELLALQENWAHMGADGCIVKYTGSQYKVCNFQAFFFWDDKLCLIKQNDGYAWYLSRSLTYGGDTNAWVSKLNISENLTLSETKWFSHHYSINNSDQSYFIGSKSVSRSEYEQEEAKWNGMTKLFIADLISYPYPSSWNDAVNQYSVIKKESSGINTGTDSSSTSTGNVTDTSAPSNISVSKNTKRTVSVGNTYQIDLNGKTGKKYRSSRKKVATVSSTGLITPKSAGKTRITFKVGRKRRTLTLTVKDPTVPTSVSLNMSGTNTVSQGDTVTLSAIFPKGTYSDIKWKSNHKSVATVKNGVVKFKKKGNVTITAIATRGKKKAKVKFKVTKYDGKKDLSNYGWRTVTGVSGDNKLTFRQTHTGGYMSDHRFANGEQIFVNLTWREGGDAIAYDNGIYGYVQSKYIAW